MARLIPDFVDDRTPAGEREVFAKLKVAPESWVILHSLDVAPWNRSLRTEIDFVVLVPDAGILCVEVKSHPEISFDGSRWHPPSIIRSPFKQAADGCYAFFRGLSRLDGGLRRIPITHCCFFPFAEFDLRPILSVHLRELIDGRLFRVLNGEQFAAELKQRIKESIQADRSLKPLDRPMNSREIDRILSLCVPIQKRIPSKREEIDRREEEAARALREQQRPVLKLCDDNERVLVTGPAGSGKTRIAMEVANRAVARGRRVALLCFNRLVGQWMAGEMMRGGCPPTT
jgi:hypothetical protein